MENIVLRQSVSKRQNDSMLFVAVKSTIGRLIQIKLLGTSFLPKHA